MKIPRKFYFVIYIITFTPIISKYFIFISLILLSKFDQKYKQNMNCKKIPAIHQQLAKFYFWTGGLIADHPLPFAILPVLIGIALSAGNLLINERLVYDPVYLFTPINARSAYELQTITEHWPIDEDNFIPGQEFNLFRTAQVIVTAANKGENRANFSTNSNFDLKVKTFVRNFPSSFELLKELSIIWGQVKVFNDSQKHSKINLLGALLNPLEQFYYLFIWSFF